MTDFASLPLAAPILRSIEDAGYKTPTPIQAQAIPALLEGNNLLGVAQTGTGKTAAFTLPLLHRVAELSGKSRPGKPHALILAPTRELAGQIGESLKLYGAQVPLRTCTVFGGSSMRTQIRQLQRGVHILVATPGRLMDLGRQGHVDLTQLDIFVLDEADRMLDMGFIGDVKKIAQELPEGAQRVMFSATMPKAVQGLADQLLQDPVKVEVAREATTHENIEQRLLYVAQDKKRALLSHLLDDDSVHRVLIFTRTKRGADRVTKYLTQNNIQAQAFHGDKNQNQRQRALKAFKQGRVRALVATDVAARGIDVDGVTHVINYEMPTEPDSYVHRIGRTGRGGASGISITMCDRAEKGGLYAVEKTIRQPIPVFVDHPFHCEETANAKSKGLGKPKQRKRNSRGKRPQAGGQASGGRRSDGGRSENRRANGGFKGKRRSSGVSSEGGRGEAQRTDGNRSDTRRSEGGFKGKRRSNGNGNASAGGRPQQGKRQEGNKSGSPHKAGGQSNHKRNSASGKPRGSSGGKGRGPNGGNGGNKPRRRAA